MALQNQYGSLALDQSLQPVSVLAQSVGAANAYAQLATGSRATVLVAVSGTFTGTLSLQAVLDGTNAVTVAGPQTWLNLGTGAYSATITTAGLYQATVSSFLTTRLTMTAYTSGTATVTMAATDGNASVALDAPLPAGTSRLGTVGISDGTSTAAIKAASTAAAATDPALVVALHPSTGLPQGSNTLGNIANIGSSVTPGTNAGNLGKAEDAVHASGDVGVAALAVRAPATPATRTDAAGDYINPIMDAEGKTVVAGTADPVNSWQGNVTQATTTAAAIKTAAAAGIRNYVTDLTVSNSSATAVLVQVLDGTTVIWQQWLPATTGVITRSFNTPLRGTAATALNVNLGAAVTSVYFSASGYIGV